ncbi:hypothetical protein Y032_0228g2885 [Ancylostoma ceylanicum]|uniref:GIY-YIG domain-containing protein n=1 Tax=Ancylostoma ceylanicum TaxID=53326 RepID=A0A016SGC2_9BILA|nr:hypothetical protein Y032_0228g2885 [Ancylostoma ceylanicum]
MISGTFYLITCQACGNEYIEGTGRPLRVRIKEHLDGLSKSKTAFGYSPKVMPQNTEIQIGVTILLREPEVIARRTLEAFWITAKSPKMNRKDECIAITKELALYRGFDLWGRVVKAPYRPLGALVWYYWSAVRSSCSHLR